MAESLGRNPPASRYAKTPIGVGVKDGMHCERGPIVYSQLIGYFLYDQMMYLLCWMTTLECSLLVNVFPQHYPPPVLHW